MQQQRATTTCNNNVHLRASTCIYLYVQQQQEQQRALRVKCVKCVCACIEKLCTHATRFEDGPPWSCPFGDQSTRGYKQATTSE